jgi:hypothetical protein
MKPYLRGIVDTLVGAEIIIRYDIPHKNRLGVILYDSAFETACRAYLKYKAKISLDDSHKRRENLVKTIKSKLIDIDESVWESIDYYYLEVRNDFYHQSASKTIIDNDYLDYKDTIEFVINNAFEIKISDLVREELEKLIKQNEEAENKTNSEDELKINIRDLSDKVDKVLVAVKKISPKKSEDLNSFFKKQGDKLRFNDYEFKNIVARNSGSKKLFFFNSELKTWELSELGEFKLTTLKSK